MPSESKATGTPPPVQDPKFEQGNELRADLSATLYHRESLERQLAVIDAELKRFEAESNTARCRERYFCGLLWLRKLLPDNWHIALLVLGTWIVGCLAFGLAILAGLETLGSVVMTLVGAVVGLLVAVHVVLWPATSHLDQAIYLLRGEITAAIQRCTALASQRSDLSAQRQHVLARSASLRSELDSRVHRLLNEPYREFRGERFEQFLAEVFDELGFEVQLTKASGDQGVDLIVTRNSLRWAVQAKGYVESVGNAAVQQAHAGKDFYGCQRSAVITNSVFTTGARELACRLSPPCMLVEGEQIPALIRGELTLV